jgi:hypothetical protein
MYDLDKIIEMIAIEFLWRILGIVFPWIATTLAFKIYKRWQSELDRLSQQPLKEGTSWKHARDREEILHDALLKTESNAPELVDTVHPSQIRLNVSFIIVRQELHNNLAFLKLRICQHLLHRKRN